jgi:hypothetical protein
MIAEVGFSMSRRCFHGEVSSHMLLCGRMEMSGKT